jgi:hypothetical protein
MYTRLLLVVLALLMTSPLWAADLPVPATLPEAIVPERAVEQELTALKTRLAELEQTRRLTATDLAVRNRKLLTDLAGQVRTQRQTMTDFSGFVTWLSGSLDGYNKYLQASAVAANLLKVLPIPYAGQASLFTKFAAQGAASLNTTSAAITRYLGTSQQFLSRAEALEKSPNPPVAEVSALAKFADEQLLKDTSDVQNRLASTADLSTSVLGFLEGLNGYLGNADHYWAKTKAFVTRNEDAAKEKGYLATSITGLRDRAGAFAKRLQTFNDLSRKNDPLVRTVRVYDSLSAELAAAPAVGGK